VLNVLGVWYILAIGVLQSVRPRSYNFGDDEGPFLSRVELVKPYLILDETEDQITDAEGPLLYVAVVVVSDAL
jgi:hypothetical protein